MDAFMYVNELEDKSINEQIKETNDETKKRKLKRQKSKNKSELKRMIGSVIQSKQEQITRITDLHRRDFIKIIETLTDNEPVIDLLLEVVKVMRLQIGNVLRSAANEASISYKEIMTEDHGKVDHANRNAIRAKEKIEKERETKLTPLVLQFGEFLLEKTTFRDNQIDKFNMEIKTVKNKIEALKQDSIDKAKQVNQELNAQISSRKQKLEEIKHEEKTEIQRRKSMIDSEIDSLKLQFESSIKLLEEKDEEAEKVYDYEGRIYQLALDTNESKYNETVQKAMKATNILRGNSNDSVQTVNEIAERNIERINKELLKETTQYENSLYTVRPRYEESIGNAQRAIDDKANIEKQRKSELIKLHNSRTSAIEEDLNTGFEYSYKTLQNNLNAYIKDYKEIEDQYKLSILSANEVISKSHSRFVRALYELGKQKIDKTNKRMSEINDKLR
jgi:predicted transglutaminase-like cysteine proteinase